MPEAGGHFFLAKYGIRIIAAANTCVVWKPSTAHGTSLQDLDPLDENPPCIQTGLAIVTPNRLSRVWKTYCEQKITQEEGCQAIFGGEEGTEGFTMAMH